MLTSRHKKAPESFDSEALDHDYYIWEEGTEDQPPEGSAAFFGGNVWEWVPQVKEYYYHTFSIVSKMV